MPKQTQHRWALVVETNPDGARQTVRTASSTPQGAIQQGINFLCRAGHKKDELRVFTLQRLSP